MKISICVPVYGVETYIARCAKSLFEQTYQDIEYVFINDCTKDRSIEVLQSVIEQYPTRATQVKIVNHQINKGLAGARNTGVNAADGEFILWVDSDDSIDSTLIEKLVEKQQQNNADIVCYDTKVLFKNYIDYYRNGDYIDGKDLANQMLLGRAPHQLCGHLIRKSLYLDNGICAVEGVNQGEDYQVMPRLAYFAQSVDTLHEVLYYYDRTTENSYSNNYSPCSCRQVMRANKIIRDFFQNKELCFQESLMSVYPTDIANMLLYTSRFEDGTIYSEVISELKTIDRSTYKSVRIDKRVVLYCNNKIFVRYYSKLREALGKLFFCGKHIIQSIIYKKL